jgi:hypothetical protein
MSEHDERFTRNLKKTLDAGAEQIDAATLARLRAVRREALHAGAPRPWRWALPAAGMATVAAIALTVYWLPQEVTPGAASFEEAALLQAEDPELYRDLEFYEWLEQASAEDKDVT